MKDNSQCSTDCKNPFFKKKKRIPSLKTHNKYHRICWFFFLIQNSFGPGGKSLRLHSEFLSSGSFSILPAFSLTSHVVRTQWPKPRKPSGCDAIRECADFIQISPALLLMALFLSGMQARIQAAGCAQNSSVLWQGFSSAPSWLGPSERALVVSVMRNYYVGVPKFFFNIRLRSCVSGW